MTRTALVLLGFSLHLFSACTTKISDEKLKKVDRVAIIYFSADRYPKLSYLRTTEQKLNNVFSAWPDDIHQDAMEEFVSTLTHGSRFHWLPTSKVVKNAEYLSKPVVPDMGNLGTLISLKGMTHGTPLTPGGYGDMVKALNVDLVLTFTTTVSMNTLDGTRNMNLGGTQATVNVDSRVQGFDASGSCIWNEGGFEGDSEAVATDKLGYPEREAYRSAIKDAFRKAAARIKERMDGGKMGAATSEKPGKKKRKKTQD